MTISKNVERLLACQKYIDWLNSFPLRAVSQVALSGGAPDFVSWDEETWQSAFDWAEGRTNEMPAEFAEVEKRIRAIDPRVLK